MKMAQSMKSVKSVIRNSSHKKWFCVSFAEESKTTDFTDFTDRTSGETEMNTKTKLLLDFDPPGVHGFAPERLADDQANHEGEGQ